MFQVVQRKHYFSLRTSAVLRALLTVWILSAFATACAQTENIVRTPQEYEAAVKNAKPGDVIVLANGIWRDFDILFTGEGTEKDPITLTVQTQGKVILSGQSSLRLAGEYLVVRGLVFKDGYTPRSEVISFRRNKDHVANNSRVTETVIDNFNNPERYEVDFWVMMYGKNNRFDHNHLVGKKNKGVTMAVRLNSEASQENHHRIDHNYFGPRPVLGSNGGETLRIGTSHYSLTDSYTVVENNYFDRCDGELEIISVKSGKNTIRDNVFYESSGTLTLRHGNGNKITGNVFFGNGKDHTGGIRVINENQTIENNYMEGLTGYRFAGALVVMNGVPNSPINRYHQVKNASIRNNSIINSDHIQLAAGSDQERSAVPVTSVFEGNLIFHQSGGDLFTVYDDISGIAFRNNLSHLVEAPALEEGFEFRHLNMTRADNGLLYSDDQSISQYGVSKDLTPVTRDDVGVSWYPKSDPSIKFGSGRTIDVKPGSDPILEAVEAASAGDVLRLRSGTYHAEKILKLDKPLTIKSNGSGDKPVIEFSRSALFELHDGGSLRLEGVVMTGAEAPDNVGNSLIRTSKYSMLNNYRLELVDVDIQDLDINRAFNVFTVAKGTMADQILISDSTITDVSGAVLKLNKEDDDFGIFNADYVTIQKSRFSNIGEEITNLYRGGRDESTFGPHFAMTGSEVSAAGLGSRNKSGASILLHGVQVTSIDDNTFSNSAGIEVEHTVSEPVTRVTNNRFYNTAGVHVTELVSEENNTAFIEGNLVEQGAVP